ncbi:adenine methyltransferase [Lactococcus garvieae]
MTYNQTAQHSTAQHSTAQHSTAQHSTAQHSTAQHSTAQHSTAQHSTARGRFPPLFLAPKRSGPLERFFRPLTLSAEGQVKRRSKDKKES